MFSNQDLDNLLQLYLVILAITGIAISKNGCPPRLGACGAKSYLRSYPRLTVDFTYVLVWPLILFDNIQYLVSNIRTYIRNVIGAISRVAYVDTYVTGFWEVHEKKEYCLGPMPSPRDCHIDAEQIYVVVEEEILIVKHSVWPAFGIKFGEALEEDDWTGYGEDVNYEPAEFAGQLNEAEVGTIQSVTYYLLALSRFLCHRIILAAVDILPSFPPAIRVLKSEYEVYPAPTQDQIMEATLANVYTSQMYKPLKEDLIRGPDALDAARRAGFMFPL